MAILTTFLSSFLPFFLANIVAIPVMKLINLIKNKYGIVLCVTILVVVGIFVAYMQLLKSLVGFYIEKDMALFSPEVMGRIGKFAAGAFPFNLYANMLLGRHPYINLIYVLLLTTGVGLIAMLIVKSGISARFWTASKISALLSRNAPQTIPFRRSCRICAVIFTGF